MAEPKIYGFFSAKGGTGKTALVTAAAFALQAKGEQVAVLDADFIGTSIADGLALQAPGPDGAMLSVEETRAARHDPSGPELPFLDAAMVADAPPFDPAATAWRHPEAPKIAWYPSSPLTRHDERIRANILAPERDEVEARFTAVLRALIEAPERPATCLLIDMGPGIYGMPGVVAGAAAAFSNGYRALLVSTPDRNDLARSADLAAHLLRGELPVRWLLNRNEDQPVEAIRNELRERMGRGRRHGIWSVLEDFGHHERLRDLYRRDTIGFTADELARFADLILLGGL
jgi:hypothetical protein